VGDELEDWMKGTHTSMIIRTVVVVLLCILPACGGPGDETSVKSQDQAVSPGAERLQPLVERLQTEHGLPGLSVAIAEADGQPLTATAGFADLERKIPVAPGTKFFIGSVSKNIFAAIALKLVDQGRLRLESPLSAYLDWPRGEEVTLKMLLNHTSGVPEYLTPDLFEPGEDGGIPEFFRTPWAPADVIAAIPEKELVFDPGSRQEYSNTNGLLVGEILRRVVHQPLADVLEDLITQPLGLQNMYLYGESTADRDRARGYSAAEYWGAEDGELVDCSSGDDALLDSGDGSVVSNAEDLLLYHQALREGEVLSDTSWVAMCTVEPGIHNGLGYLITEGEFGRAEGNVGRSMGHVVANVYYLDHKTYVVMMTNRSDAPLPLQEFLRQWFEPQE
jgi:D-alanyl-D-alanine carboxypeptidase